MSITKKFERRDVQLLMVRMAVWRCTGAERQVLQYVVTLCEEREDGRLILHARHDEIARDCFRSRPVVSKALSSWEKKGVLCQISHGQIEVLPSGYRKAVEGSGVER